MTYFYLIERLAIVLVSYDKLCLVRKSADLSTHPPCPRGYLLTPARPTMSLLGPSTSYNITAVNNPQWYFGISLMTERLCGF